MTLASLLTPVRMSKVRALILDKYIESVLRTLQSAKIVHLIDLRERVTRWENLPEPYANGDDIRRWQDLSFRLERILTELEIKGEMGLLEQLFKPRERKPIEIKLEEETAILDQAETLVEEVEREIREKVVKFRLIRRFLWQLRGEKIKLEDLRPSNVILIKVGRASIEDITAMERELETKVKYATLYAGGRERRKFVVLTSLNRFSDEVERILKEHNFEEIPLPKEISGGPSSYLRVLDEQVSEMIRRNERKILCLYDAVQAKIERLRAMEKLGRTNRVFILEGWVPQDSAKSVETLITDAAEGCATVLVSPPDEPEASIPTLPPEHRVVKSFRILTEMYGTPSYNEIDPTPFLAIFFTIFVGLMSADIAVGALVLLAGYLIVRGAGTRSENMKSLGHILIYFGVSAVLFGFLMGEFMGGLIRLPALWISGADEPITFLVIVIAIGVGHIIFGMFLGIYNNYLNRRFRRILADQVSLLILIAGVGIMVATGETRLYGTGIISYSLIIGGLAMLLIGQGLSGLLEITRLLSNVISYVRILALNMASTWMARTFVLLGTMLVEIPIVGYAMTAILLLFSHIFIVFISTFATFAHALRLHYVEFFGRFFIGGGTKFSPLKAERAYTVIKG
jgi:V/A-type H+-transporting ATPase subunit I